MMDKKLILVLVLTIFIQKIKSECSPPRCDTDEQRNTLFTHADSTKFWQCAPIEGLTWAPKEMPCSPKTQFCEEYQVCIHPENWTEEKCGCEKSDNPAEVETEPSDNPGGIEGLEPNPSPNTCEKPSCATDEQKNTLYPHADPTKFWQCAPKSGLTWEAKEMPCGAGTQFCKENQVCIHTADWTVEKCGCEKSVEEGTDNPGGIGGNETNPTPKSCEKPSCATDEQRNTLHPHTDPTKFWQCAPIGGISWAPREMPCGVGTQFCKENQVCIHTADWTAEKCGCEGFTGEETESPGGITGTEPNPPASAACEASCKTKEDQNTHWTHEDNTKFWQCRPFPGHIWELQEMPCSAGTWFCYEEQVCIWPHDWTAEKCKCGHGNNTPTPTQTPSTPTDTTANTPTDTTPSNTPSDTTPSDTTPSNTPTDTTPAETTTDSNAGSDWEVVCNVLPDCKKENLLTIWPHVNTVTYWQCELFVGPEGGTWKRVQKNCTTGTDGTQLKFNFNRQRCVHPNEWIDYCATTDPKLCAEPRCLASEEIMKFPHFNPKLYYTCTGLGESAVEECPKDLLFSFEAQKCIDKCLWNNPCTKL
jgi:hypothetical protein